MFPATTPGLKICGVTREHEAQQLAALGVHALGVNFWPKSKRHVDPAHVAWLATLAGRITRVGVFVNPDPTLPVRLFEQGLIDIAQLHGEEATADTRLLHSAGLPFIKATGVASVDDLERCLDHQPLAVLADAPAPGVYGGTGRVLDWQIARDFTARHPAVQLILAGGITPDNAAAALAAVRPAAIDVASGAEILPGIKDFAKVEALLAIVHASPPPARSTPLP